MHAAEQLSLAQIRAFLNAGEGAPFEGKTEQRIYQWIANNLVHHRYQAAKAGQFVGVTTIPGEE